MLTICRTRDALSFKLQQETRENVKKCKFGAAQSKIMQLFCAEHRQTYSQSHTREQTFQIETKLRHLFTRL